MADVVFVGIVVAFFGLAVGFTRACARIVGASAVADEGAGDTGSAVRA